MNTKALIAAAVAALAGAAMLYLYMRRFEETASGGPEILVVMATQDIPLGAQITREMIGTRPLPSSYVEDRHIRASDAEKILGIRISSGVRANESVLWTDLATTTEQRRDLSSLVRPGFRAATVRADTTSTFGDLLRPGDRVDVALTTVRNPAEGRALVTVPLLQSVLVLAVGEDTGAEDLTGGQRTRRYQQVTLSVTVEQAHILTLAAAEGTLSLTLRNPDDIAILDGLPETTREDILEPQRRARLLRRERTDDQPTLPTRVE